MIELLVVIAIIGILSSVVLASLNTARSKAGDAAVKSNLAGIRAQAELVYDTDGDYEDVCEDSNVTAAVAAAASAAGVTVGSGEDAHCLDSTSGYTVYSALKSNADSFWCVDSNGASKATTTDMATITTPVSC